MSYPSDVLAPSMPGLHLNGDVLGSAFSDDLPWSLQTILILNTTLASIWSVKVQRSGTKVPACVLQASLSGGSEKSRGRWAATKLQHSQHCHVQLRAMLHQTAHGHFVSTACSQNACIPHTFSTLVSSADLLWARSYNISMRVHGNIGITGAFAAELFGEAHHGTQSLSSSDHAQRLAQGHKPHEHHLLELPNRSA